MTPEEELRRAGEAKQILNSALFLEARKNLEEQLASLRRSVPIRETEMHTRLIIMEQIKENFFGFFDQLAQTGRMAELHLQEKERQRGLLERGLLMFRTAGRNGL